jgi:hypothetical protein
MSFPMTTVHSGGRLLPDTTRPSRAIIRGHGRRAMALALAVTIDLIVSARTNAARASAQMPAHEMALEMMPDDAFSPADESALAQLHEAIAALGLSEPRRRAGGRTIEGIARHHAGLVLRWLLGDQRRIALGYERGALLDVLVTSNDGRVRAVAAAALLSRPGLGYCMHALPPLERAGRLASVVRELTVIEALRREAARLLLDVGEPAEAARARAEARASAERIALDQPRVVRRWLLDETDVGLFDTYRAEIVAAFRASAVPPLRALAIEVAGRRARLVSAADTRSTPVTTSITTKPALTAAR